MDLIDKHLPLSSKGAIDKLIDELLKVPGSMSKLVRNKIYYNINKWKLQEYFQETYPENLFCEPDMQLPEIRIEDQEPQEEVLSQKDMMIPVPKSTLGSKKYIYGTYIEMAFHNMFLTMKHIYAVVFGRDIMMEACGNFIPKKPGQTWDGDFANEVLVWNPIFDAFRTAKPEETVKIEEMLSRHFPLLIPFTDYTKHSKKYEKYSYIDIIRSLSKTLRVMRNVYAHYKITLLEDQINTYLHHEELVRGGLEKAYLGSCRKVKERFALTENELRCTQQYEFTTDKSKRDERGRPLKQKKEISGFRYKLWDNSINNERHLTEFGILSLTSLFLEKKYSKIMADKLHLVAEHDKPVVCEMTAVYRIRLNAQRITVKKDTEALALDIINEMQRCPKDLFEILTPEAQKQFRVMAETEEQQDVLMVRHTDRFAQMVLKYIDDAHLFEDIRFQVSLGRYFYKFYNKYCIDTQSEARVRAICKNINGFGRIEEIDIQRDACWSEILRQYEDVHKNTADEKPYVTDHHAQYIINSNKIGLRIMEGDCRSYIPELTTEGARNLVPTCWLSVYELSALTFLLHLTGDGSRVEDLIKSTVANYRRFFSDVEQGILLPVNDENELKEILHERYSIIEMKDVPQNMLDYLLCRTHDAKERFRKVSATVLERLIEQTNYKIKKYKEQKQLVDSKDQNKIGKKSYVVIKPGKLADFLAKDIMQFQPNNQENNNRLTSLNYRILQAVLATYKNGDTDKLRHTLTSAHIIGRRDDAMCNPIVMRMWSKSILPSNTEGFYEMYLNERLAYLTECKQSGDYESLYFLHSNRIKWQEHDEEFLRHQAARYLADEYCGTRYEKAIELPRGMFEKAIREELKTIPAMRSLAEDETKNISYLIVGYFQKVMQDDCQTFYDEKRSYRLFNTLYRKGPRDSKKYRTAEQIRLMLIRKHASSVIKDINSHIRYLRPSDQKSEREKLMNLLKEVKNSETDFKRYKVQDMLLFLIAKRIFMSNVDDNVQCNAFESIKLRDLLNGEALSQKIKVRIKVISKKGYSKYITKDDLKLKNYANFYQVLNDRRLPALLDIVMEREIDHSYLESEFCGFDKVCPSVIEEVFRYEKEYYEQHPDVEFEHFGRMIEQSTEFDYEKKKSLRKTRNSFLHNTYPKYSEVKIAAETALPKKAIALSDKFKRNIRNQE